MDGDFNIPINKLDGPDTIYFVDTMCALGLNQYVSGKTHKKGNTTDHVYLESGSSLLLKKFRAVRLCIRP